jgi:DNA-binding GntR family transcriptional regulator
VRKTEALDHEMNEMKSLGAKTTAVAHPAKRTCMRDHIRDVLVARILDSTYAAGTQLKELSLAREFNVSQAPICQRSELEGSGLVTSERYRTRAWRGFPGMRESYELRATLEVRAELRPAVRARGACRARQMPARWWPRQNATTPKATSTKRFAFIAT